MKNHKTAVVLGPVIFFTAALTYFLLLPSSASRPHATPMASTLEFETVPGYFLQDDLETDAPSFDYVRVARASGIWLWMDALTSFGRSS